MNMMMYNKKGATAAAAAAAKKPAGDFKPIASYKPTGNLIYNQDLFKKIEDRMWPAFQKHFKAFKRHFKSI